MFASRISVLVSFFRVAWKRVMPRDLYVGSKSCTSVRSVGIMICLCTDVSGNLNDQYEVRERRLDE
jgi:hypothetical protein